MMMSVGGIGGIKAVVWRLLFVFSFFVIFCTRGGTSFHSRPSQHLFYRGNKIFQTISTEVLAETTSRQAQVLSFIEPSTNTTVILVGAMHYNPRSIELAKSTIEEYAEKDELGSVIIESCAIRWRKTIDLLSPSNPSTNPNILQTLQKQWRLFAKQKLFYNEMYAAEETAKRYNIPVILGDQLINETSASIGNGFKRTLKDLIQPFQGWERIKQDLQNTYPIAMPSGEGYLGIEDYLNLQLLISTPVTLFRYPLSIALRAPLLLIPIFISALIGVLPNYLPTLDILTPFIESRVVTESTSIVEPVINVIAFSVGSVVLPLLEFVLLARVFLISILAERNVVLAENILQQCQMIANKNQDRRLSTTSTMQALNILNMDMLKRFLPEQLKSLFPENQIRDNNNNNGASERISEDPAAPRKVVVAVLGMAHCNGIKKLLTSSMVQAPTTTPSIVNFDQIIAQ